MWSLTRTGNPILDNFSELVTLDSRDCADTSVVESVNKLGKRGKEQYQKYVTDATKDRLRSIYNPIKQNNLPLFSKNYKKEDSKEGKNIAVLQSNLNLVAQLCVALQSRDGDMREFFSHEVSVLSTCAVRVRSKCQVRSLKMSAAN